MDFEIKDLEIIDSTQAQTATENTKTSVPNSIILNELHKENEEMQNKLKLNYRRLLLFEAENNKLIEEKNKLFFENQNYFQINQLVTEKNAELEKQKTLSDSTHKLLVEKMQSLETINRTQMTEIRRFSKFHTKIQEVVKPLVAQLKNQIADLKTELIQTKKINENLNLAFNELKNTADLELTKRANMIANLTSEKNGLINTYEEQIHTFSKEILELQSRCEDGQKEISRLKKAIEFKNYFENEVIRFKRIHEEDQIKINELTQRKSSAEAKLLSNEQNTLEIKTELSNCKNRLADIDMNLEVTRNQLSKKIDELTVANERLSRLEKLNNQLSLEMSLKQN